MNIFRKFLIATAIPLSMLNGCAGISVTSEYVENTSNIVSGFTYSLPRGYVPLAVKRDSKGVLTITSGELQYVPDPDVKYLAHFKTSAFATDDFKITTNNKGLLTAANSTNQDQSLEITKKVLSIVTEVAKFAGTLRTDRTDGPQEAPFTISTLFDPFNKHSVSDATSKLKKNNVKLRIRMLNGEASTDYVRRGGVPVDCQSSFCFRLLTPVLVDVEIDDAKATFLALAPDPTRLAGYDVRRGPCITRLTELSFNEGILTSSHLNKPSEVLGCLDIPLEVIRTIIALPSSFFTFRVLQVQRDTEVLQTQQKYLNAQKNLIDTQAALLEAKSKATETAASAD